MIFALGVFEIGLRLFDPFAFSHGRAREVLTAKIIGSHGMCNPETPIEKPEGTYRILMLGDSVAFGWGVAEEDAFPRVVERMLREDGTPAGYERIEVINAAVPGRNLVDNFLFLKERGMGYEPDLIFLTLLNDDVPSLDENGQEIDKAKGIILPTWTKVLDSGRLLQLLLDRFYKVKKRANSGAIVSVPKGGLMHACELFRRFKVLCQDIPIVIIDTFGKRGETGLPDIIACCKKYDLPRITTYLWSEKYKQEYAVSETDDHPNAQGHLDMARPVVRWCRDNLPK